ncbi:Coiled-coil domain-containing protein 84 [Macleaya cordata]|uniref:Coiled-coil domain-containing protein 84 n=1 Tax=Macleaya cordata TaxID=56857 RepID=A0A200QGA6_MACCD|nr:Coiled-coil domain-containing protein 84 [Macleaya cordata]
MEEEKKKQNPNNKKKKEKNNDLEFEFCKVCKLNHDQGRRHKYFPNHTKSLSSFLTRFHKKLSDIRFFLKNPTVLRPEHASRNRLWCVFCDCDIEELDSLFACSNAINHLASSEHLKNLKDFLWRYGGGMDRVDSFRVSETDLSKWEKRCGSLKSAGPLSNEGSYGPSLGPSKDIHNQLSSETTDNLEKNTIYSFNSSLSNGFVPLQYFTNEKHQEPHREVTGVETFGSLQCDATSFPVGTQSNSYVPGMQVTYDTTKDLKDYRDKQHNFVVGSRSSFGCAPSDKAVYQVGRLSNGESCKQEPKDNVHAGAPPPWLETDEENQLHRLSAGVNDNGLASSLHKSGKSQKLNPKRVGAAWAEKRKLEMEMEKRGEIVTNNCDADWLPNFGRVWQSGSRKESRKEFEMEKQKSKVDSPSDVPIKIQPYISKRMVPACRVGELRSLDKTTWIHPHPLPVNYLTACQ